MKTLSLPFSGFYESIHDSLLDDAYRDAISDENGDIIESLQDDLYMVQDARPCKEYAKEYARAFVSYVAFNCELELNIKFEKLQSPREYNFTTDEIICTIDKKSIKKLYKAIKGKVWKKYVREHCTSRSGFHSFYSPDVSTWGKVRDYDHAQLTLLLACWLDNETGGELYRFEIDLIEQESMHEKAMHAVWDIHHDALNKLHAKAAQ